MFAFARSYFVCLSLKDDEINHQSQMVEKLKEQMLDQEEVKDLSLTCWIFVCMVKETAYWKQQ